MNELQIIAEELHITGQQVKAVAALLEEGATVPFIARYRKEAHQSLDEVAIVNIRDRLQQLRELAARKEAISKSLSERQLLSDELREAIEQAPAMSRLEDIYLPFRPKKRTRAMLAREKGLEGLALLLLEQREEIDPVSAAEAFVSPGQGVLNAQEALSGARDIIAEIVNEDQNCRAALRALFQERALFSSKVISGQEEAGAKYRDYFAWQEPAKSAPSHRVLAMRRGEKEGFLSLRVLPESEPALALLGRLFLKNRSRAGQQVLLAVEDSYKRLLSQAMETEIRLSTRQTAEREAIKVFAQNLRQLLLAAPLGQKRVLAIDPGFRTGCKLAILNAQGELLAHEVIYIMSDRQREQAGVKIEQICREYALQAIAIGNGTAGRESEALIRGLKLKLPVVVVNESGASIYSASEIARQEFPDLDLSVRGAISIGRRLMDPLAELVKIDPKSIGVGQYQHDVDQPELKQSLDDVVLSCVNSVGVELNTASAQLLSHVSGLGPGLARNIVLFREQKGPFLSRRQLLEVPRLGPKAFEQAAGFLRISNAANPLDASAVHPEAYGLVEAMAEDLSCTLLDLLQKASLRQQIRADKYVNEKFGLPTINDILGELEKPGRDPRQSFEAFSFSDRVNNIDDLQPGMKLTGVVTNITNFGAFVDIGVHQDGLVHISNLADKFVSDPHQVVKVQQTVMVRVLEVDPERKRIALSLRGDEPAAPQTIKPRPAARQPKLPPPPKSAFNNPFARALGGLEGDRK